MPSPHTDKPIVLITGAAGDVGSALVEALSADYQLVGLDRSGAQSTIPSIEVDLGREDSVREAMATFRARHGSVIASVIHLAAYFDFTGEDNPLYRTVNVEGTQSLLRALQDFTVAQFVYSGTMLVHAPGAPGERIDESSPIAPKWAYPRSKADAEAVIRRDRGNIPIVLLHLAGLYDETRCVPTLAQQIGRIYERDVKSHLYAGDLTAGQSLLHKEDMVDAFRRTVDRRHALPPEVVVLIGEPETLGYDELQDALGQLIHGEDEWTTLRLPKPAAQLGALLEEKLEPVVPDAIDQGEKPFIRPFMVAMADDHYALDIGRARELLGWEPRHRIARRLPALVEGLKADPTGWYAAQGMTPPTWMQQADAQGDDPEALRTRHEEAVRTQHAQYLWAPFLNIGLGAWLLCSPVMLALESRGMALSDAVSGLALMAFAALSLSWQRTWARFACAAVGLWVLFAPLVFWAPTPAGYLNGTLVGTLAIGLALLTPPEPGVSPVASLGGPDVPPGWDYNPSNWTQRVAIIVLAMVGLHISRYLVAYQLGHVDGVWDPFFAGGPDPKNGTEEIITSSVSQAWPVPDAGLGALTYALEILTGLAGSRRRWRTMPWLVLLFGAMIVPLGAVSIFFIVIQPIWIGTWCTLCLVGAAAMVLQIPYSLDEILATLQFLRRRQKAGQSLLRVMMVGDTDDEDGPTPARTQRGSEPEEREFERRPAEVLRSMWAGGVALPWNLALAGAIGVGLMFTRPTLGAEGAMANMHHLIGALVVTVSVAACAQVARTLRGLNALLGLGLVGAGLAYADSGLQLGASVLGGVALVLLSLPRGEVGLRYGDWNRFIR